MMEVSDYLNRTPASASNRKIFTYSGWVKRSALGGNKAFFLLKLGQQLLGFRFNLRIINLELAFMIQLMKFFWLLHLYIEMFQLGIM
jgi:hypothetical protein